MESQKNTPEPELIKFLDEKVSSTRNRILEATGVKVDPIYYSAGYKDGDNEQLPYNLSKLLMFIVRHTKPEKRAVIINDVKIKNEKDKKNFIKDDGRENYRENIEKDILGSIMSGIPAFPKVISIVEDVVKSVSRVVTKVVDAIMDFLF